MTDRYLLCEMGRQGVRESQEPHSVKPRISAREGLGSRRIWVCKSWEPSAIPMVDTLRLGYGMTPSEAFKEWEECRV